MKKKYEVIDSDFNKANYPDLIGQVMDAPPAYANVKLITERLPMKEIYRLQSRLFQEEVSSDYAEDFVIKCLREGYEKEEIIEGIGEFFRQVPEVANNIFNRTILKIKGIKRPKATANSWYKKAQVTPDNRYSAKVTVNIWMPGIAEKYEIDVIPVFIPFNIDIEARSWGIKDITVLVHDVINVNLFVSILNDHGDVEREVEKQIPIDLSIIPKEEVSGKGICTLGELDLQLDENFNVNYEKSYLEIIK